MSASAVSISASESQRLPRLERQRRAHDGGQSNADMLPLFYAALLFLGGIVLGRFQCPRPSWLLIGLLPLAAIAVLSLIKTPRLTWLPLALIWLILGCWAAETEPQPVVDPAIALISDGLLRTVEGTVADAGPPRRSQTDTNGDSEAQTDVPSPALADGERVQSLDLRLTAAEIVSDHADAVLPVASNNSPQIRLTVRWPAGSFKGEPRAFACGERIRAVVRIARPDTYHDPGVWSRADWLQSQQISAVATVDAGKHDAEDGTPRLALLASPAQQTIRGRMACHLNALRDAASNRLQNVPTETQHFPRPLRANGDDVAMLSALLTGDRTFLTRDLRAGFERTGSFHLIVVSGLHLAILAGFVLGMANRLRISRLPATVLTILATLAYALFTGFAIPAQRSFWMITLYLIGRLFYRNRSPLNVIGFAVLCLAAASPHSIFEASFQMTLISVGAIAGIAIPLLEPVNARIQATRDLRMVAIDPSLAPRIAQFRVMLRLVARHLEAATSARIAWKIMPFLIRSGLRLAEVLFVTLTVELALALPMAIYFHRITLYALPMNLILLPLLSVLVPSAMLLLLALSAWPAVAALPAVVCLGILHGSLALVRHLGSMSLGDLRVPEPAAIATGAALLAFVTAILLAKSLIPGMPAAWQRRLALPALMAMAVFALWPRPIQHPPSALLFEAIDVGQGDALLLITPDGKTLLVDGGGIGVGGFSFPASAHRAPRAEFDTGEDVVSPVLWMRGIRRLDAVALTHAHHDHLGGLPAVLRNFRPRALWVGRNPDIPAYRELIGEAATLGVSIHALQAGQSFPFGAAEMTVLAPEVTYLPGPEPENDDSLVLRARFLATSVLLTGDAEGPEENAMLTRGKPGEESIASTVLKVGHHGSLTSTHPAFLARAAPAWAVISCGRRNRFGHPRPEILEELQAAHVRTFRTDLTGAVCFLLDGHAVQAEPMCHEPD